MLGLKGMRIGLFSDYYFSKGDGTAIATRLSRTGLSKEGHKVTVFCPQVPNQPVEADTISFKSWPGGLYPGLRLCWPFSRANLTKVSQQRLDIIHLETPILVGLFGLWCARRLRIPSAMTVHLDMDFMGGYIFRLPALGAMALMAALISRRIDANFWRMLWPRRIDRSKRRSEDFAWRAMAFTASRSGLVIAPSQKNYDQLAKYVSPSRIRLVPNGISVPVSLPTRAQARQQLKLDKQSFVVVVSARHVKEKRVDMTIEAFVRFSENRPDAILLVLNHGPLTASLTQLANDLGGGEQTIFTGLLENKDVFTHLAAADVFINASLREVISLGVLEAAAVGLPLILRDERLIEPLKNKHNGYFVKNQAEITDRLVDLYNNRALRCKMGEASKKRGQAYSLAAHTTALLAAYRELTERD